MLQEGGTLSYAADQEPTGFNNNTSKDNGTSVLNVVINMFPPVFRLHPDFSVQLNEDLMDSATQTSEDPQTIVYKIKQEAAWSDGTPVSADDFEYLWRNLNGSIKGNDVASTTGYDQIERVTGSDNGKTVTVVFSEPFTDWKSLFYGLLPTRYMAGVAGGWNTGLDKNPERIPVNDPDRVSAWEQGQSLTLVQQVKALPDVTSELNIGLSFEHLDFNFKNEHLADAAVRKAIATGLNIPEIVNRTVKQFTDKAQPLGNRIWLPGQRYYQDHFGQYGKGDVARRDGPARAGRLRQGRRRHLRQGRQAAEPAHLHHRRQPAPRDPGAAHPGPAQADRGRHQDRQRRLDQVLRRVAAPGQLRHRQLRLGRQPLRHLLQPGHLPDRRGRQLRRLREQEGRRPVRPAVRQEGPFWNSGLWAQKAA
jgi:ABC-type transport system substrate-binding protein